MDQALKLKIAEKMQETINRGPEIRAIANLMSPGASDDFLGGIIAGRLYNSFYYQCRRIKKRDPRPAEIEEFLAMVAAEWRKMVTACSE